MSKEEWFKSWFNSPYYSTLYKQRDEQEASRFIDSLLTQLDFMPGQHVLDLGCGKGRHSVHLNTRGANVTGIDLSEHFISFAKQFEKSGLTFLVGDMRTFELSDRFNHIFNLFTSFGYFENPGENTTVLKNVYRHLQEGGTFTLDYFNSEFVRKGLCPSITKEIDGIQFQITKRIENGFVVKNISFSDQNQDYSYEEQVQLFTKEELSQLIIEAGFTIMHTFGNYSLDPFDVSTSDRTIIIARK